MDFYCGALGFVPGEVMEISSGLDGIMETDGRVAPIAVHTPTGRFCA